ncbi:MAG: hypothetical protein MPN21_14420 [Thermoanaerobaculia bacterium]|nr:hypothetical protein [Thermoanaerobaculia bacterium]
MTLAARERDVASADATADRRPRDPADRLFREPGEAWWIVGLLLVGGAYLTYLQQIEPFFFLRDDNAAYYLPAYLHSHRALIEHGELAQVNLHQNNGGAHLAPGQTATLYPPTYAAVALAEVLGDLRWTMELEVGFHLLFAAIGMYLLARQLSCRPPAAAAAALVFLTMPFLVFVTRAWVVVAHGAAWGVWGLLFFLRLLESPDWKRALALAMSTTFFFFTGYPQFLVEATLFQALLLFGLWLTSPSWRSGAPRVLGYLAAAAALSAALSAPLLLPMLYQAASSARGFDGVSATLFVKWACDPLKALQAQMLVFSPNALFHASSAIYYVGLPVLAAAGYGAWKGTARQRVLAWVAALAFLSTTAWWGILYGLPVVSSFRWPIKHFLPFLYYLIPLAAVGFDRLLAQRRRTAVAFLGVTLAIPLWITHIPEARAAISPITLKEPLHVYRDDRLLGEANPSGRFATFRTLGSTAFAPQLLTHNFATMFGFRHVGGYEPLMSQTAVATSVATDFATFNVVPETVSRDIFQRLAEWGVSDVLAPTDPRLRQHLPATGAVRLSASNGGIDLYRNLLARPIIENLTTQEAIEGTFTTNSVRFEVSGQGTAVRLALLPLPGWSASVDGAASGRPREHPDGGFVVGVPPGRHHVELRYSTPFLTLGIVVGSLSWIAALVSLLRRR